ncbi:MAG: NADH-quinone oxidoreductase subunit I [Acidimicrobiia bacterium]
MARADVWFETPPFRDDYQLVLVEDDYVKSSVKPKQFLHIDQSECILCEGCVDICPWKCIHYLSLDAITDAKDVANPAVDDPEAQGFFVVDEDECTRCALCIDRCPTNVITLGKFEGSLAEQALERDVEMPWSVDTGQRDFKNGYTYGMRW